MNRNNIIINTKKRVTASDVAAHVGVSRSAVSRAFTDGASIHPEKRAKIMEAAKALGYQPNFFARTLSTPARRKRSNLVAILISDFSSPYQCYLFEELSAVLQLYGKQPMLLNVKQAEDLDDAILRLSGYQVDGAIAVVGSLPAERFGQCLKLSLPLVTLGRTDARGLIPSVQTDNLKAGKLAAARLIAQGLVRLGFVAGRSDGQASNERYRGFSEGALSHGLAAPYRLDAGHYSYRAGFALGERAIDALRGLEGVFCASDALAMGLMDSCREVGRLSVPGRLKVIGCDDVPQAAWQGYQLTSVAQPVTQIAEQVMRLLHIIWRGEEEIPMLTRLEPQLKVRRSG
ncbi:substrate-binding domain-containing protein [Brenneria populi]|uniref:Substrate-binding domain-containing protein n=1 Tax=Brenneria populi TaxID=1505588 RepID=A0ABU6JQD4_9GAMM|nr:substrate-binding domain-containing protein [Brenneria populi Li et al. 2015]